MAWYDDWDDFSNSIGGRAIKTVLDPMDLTGVGGKPYGGLDEAGGGGGESNVPPPNMANFGLPGADQRQLELNAAAFRAENRKPGQAVGSTAAGAQAQDSSFRAQQSQALERLGLLASGQDSLALPQFQRANNQNIAQQRSLAASASPGNSAAMARLAAQNIGNMGADFGSRAAELGIQERNAATNALGMLASQARGQDQSLNQFNAGARQQNNQFNAGQQQQNSQFNVNAGLQQTGLNDRAAADARELELRNAGMMQAGSMGYEQNNTTRYGIDKGVPAAPTKLEQVGGLLGAAAPFMSDERTKTNVSAMGGDDLDRLIGQLRPRSFEYRGGVEPMSGRPDGGPRLGVMAQDVESGGPAGQAMVQDVGGLKAIDTGKATGTALALLGRLGERMDALEGATAARTKQTPPRSQSAADAAPAPIVRPEELSRELKRTTRPEELQRERVDVPTGYRPLPAPRMAR